MAARYIPDRHSFAENIVTRVVYHFLHRFDRLSRVDSDSATEVEAQAATQCVHPCYLKISSHLKPSSTKHTPHNAICQFDFDSTSTHRPKEATGRGD